MTRPVQVFGAASLFVSALWLFVGAAFGSTSWAQTSGDLTIEGVEFGDDATTRIELRLSGFEPSQVQNATFSVTEDGMTVEATPTVELASVGPDPEPRTVMIAIDVSDSTQGEPRARAVEGASALADSLTNDGIAVGLVSFQETAELVVAPTFEADDVRAAMADLQGGFGTALNDAVVISSRALSNFRGDRDIVVFSDGADFGSDATLSDAVQASTTVGAPVTTVALQTPGLDVEALDALASGSGGRVIQVAGVDSLGSAFADVATQLIGRYVLSYPTTDTEGQFDVLVTMTTPAGSQADSAGVYQPPAPRTDLAPNAVASADPGPLGDPWIRVVGVTMATLAVVLVLVSLFVPAGDRDVARNLEAALGGGGGAGSTNVAPRQDLSPTTAAMSRRAVELVERVPRPEGYDAAVQLRIDRAGWPLRSTEFTTARAIVSVAALGLGWSLGNLVVGLLVSAAGWSLPNVVLSIRLDRHQKRFMEQLPDTLQLLSGSLKAGYGVLQAIDTVAKESPEPTRSEFQRVLSEARLGLELDDSLMEMSERVGADDFRWVAVSISIQRRVGGNLAQLLETVASTLRERASTRRQIRALSAEGRLSAYVLVGLPFGLALYLYTVNRDYLAPLWTTGRGQVMLAGAALLMAGGVVWMKNLIEIDV